MNEGCLLDEGYHLPRLRSLRTPRGGVPSGGTFRLIQVHRCYMGCPSHRQGMDPLRRQTIRFHEGTTGGTCGRSREEGVQSGITSELERGQEKRQQGAQHEAALQLQLSLTNSDVSSSPEANLDSAVTIHMKHYVHLLQEQD